MYSQGAAPHSLLPAPSCPSLLGIIRSRLRESPPSPSLSATPAPARAPGGAVDNYDDDGTISKKKKNNDLDDDVKQGKDSKQNSNDGEESTSTSDGDTEEEKEEVHQKEEEDVSKRQNKDSLLPTAAASASASTEGAKTDNSGEDKKRQQYDDTQFFCETLVGNTAFSLLETEAQVNSAVAVLMPILQQVPCHTSFDCEWHQPENVNFLSPLTVHSLVQIGIAEAPLTRESSVLVLVFDILKLPQSVISRALQLIMHTTASAETLQFAFDCRRDAKILMKYGVRLHNVLDLQLLERATRVETVPNHLAGNYVFRLSGLLRALEAFPAMAVFQKFKQGVNADDSAEVFLRRPLGRETVLYSSVDVAALFFLYVEYELAMGQMLEGGYMMEVLEASQRYATFDMQAEDVRFNEHGLLPLRILPRLDGNRVGEIPCAVCKRPVAKQPGPCLVCRKRAQDLQNGFVRNKGGQQQNKNCGPNGNGGRPQQPKLPSFPVGSPVYTASSAGSPAGSPEQQRQQQQQQEYVRLGPGAASMQQHHHYNSFAQALSANNGGGGLQQHQHQQQQQQPMFMAPHQQAVFFQSMPPQQQHQFGLQPQNYHQQQHHHHHHHHHHNYQGGGGGGGGGGY